MGSVFSQWAKTTFKDIEGRIFNTAEQFMFFHKAKLFNDLNIMEEIMKTKDPKKQKALGRKVKNFSEEKWNEYKLDIVTLGNFYKFSQNEEALKEMFRYEQSFVEASPVDNIWGIGLHWNDPLAENKKTWKGQNLLGKALNETKRIIKENDLEKQIFLENKLYLR